MGQQMLHFGAQPAQTMKQIERYRAFLQYITIAVRSFTRRTDREKTAVLLQVMEAWPLAAAAIYTLLSMLLPQPHCLSGPYPIHLQDAITLAAKLHQLCTLNFI